MFYNPARTEQEQKILQQNQETEALQTIAAEKQPALPESGPANYTNILENDTVSGISQEISEIFADLNQEEIGSILANVQSGRKLFTEKDYSKALHEYNEAISLAPQVPFLYLERGQVYLGLNNFDKAQKDFEQAIRLEPNQLDAYRINGYTHFLKEYQQAVDNYNQILKRHGQDLKCISTAVMPTGNSIIFRQHWRI